MADNEPRKDSSYHWNWVCPNCNTLNSEYEYKMVFHCAKCESIWGNKIELLQPDTDNYKLRLKQEQSALTNYRLREHRRIDELTTQRKTLTDDNARLAEKNTELVKRNLKYAERNHELVEKNKKLIKQLAAVRELYNKLYICDDERPREDGRPRRIL